MAMSGIGLCYCFPVFLAISRNTDQFYYYAVIKIFLIVLFLARPPRTSGMLLRSGQRPFTGFVRGQTGGLVRVWGRDADGRPHLRDEEGVRLPRDLAADRTGRPVVLLKMVEVRRLEA